MVLPILDLVNPGRFWATAENEETSTFHLVIPGPQYSAENLTANPNVNPGDQLMQPFSVAHGQVDGEGRAVLDLKASGRAQQILQKLDERFEQGMPAVTTARAIVIVSALKGNRVPAKQLAAVQDFELPATPRMSVREVRTYVTVNQFKQGWTEFFVDVLCQTLNEVELKISNGGAIHVDGGPSGNGTVKVPIPGGKRFRVRIPVPFNKREETMNVHKPYRWLGGWYLAEWNELHARELWTGGDITLTVTGRGGREIVQNVRLRAESWASAWLLRGPPQPMRHRHC